MGRVDAAALARAARDPDADSDAVRAALDALLVADAPRGIDVVFELLAREPRLKPSRGLLVDPGDIARRRWRQRVSAAAALLESPALTGVFAELVDELSDDHDLAGDVARAATPAGSLTAGQRERIDAVLGRTRF